MTDVRLIDANALKSKLYSLLKIEGASPVFIEGLEFALAVADVAPTIDAVPVVRCKDCVHYKPKDAMTPGDNRMRCDHPCLDYDIECYDLWLDVEPNDYCKYGEKKMDGGVSDG